MSLPEVRWPERTCHFVATPIGNLGDVTLRALAVLAAADRVYAEDTRHTGRLLQRYGLRATLDSYHDHNKLRQAPRVVQRVAAGERVAMVSDAGMPCVNDPGYVLVRALAAAGLGWTVIPGPSSVLAALVLSGLPPDRFHMLGYPPRKSGARRRFLTEALRLTGTVIVLESVHRIRATLEQLAELAPERPVAVAREITKLHEEVLRGRAAEVLARLTGPRLKGELVLVVGGRSERRAETVEDDIAAT
ncbi:MAG: 16S rRNA (cytidine(1402)-2'-O)-methyltransferase [Candidatus Krumholzibacteriia bacterium]